jgi:hypothetical protein
MSFQPVQDKQAGRNSRVYKDFKGTHFGHSPVDQPDEYAYIMDFDCWQNRLKMRAGHRKDELLGFFSDIDALFSINIMQRGMMGMITNGNLSAYLTDDILNGIQNYYTWDELRTMFTWDELQSKTWRDIVTGR